MMMSTIQPPNLPRTVAARIIPIRLRRFWLIALFFSVWALLIVGKLFVLQVVRHGEFQEKAAKQQLRTYPVAPRRGVLYDRNLRELAMTVQVDSIYAVPVEIEDKKSAAVALAGAVHTVAEDEYTSEGELDERLESGKGFAWVARRVTPEVAQKVRDLGLKGIYFQKEFQRFYPDQGLAAQVLGYVGLDDNGLGGVEQRFDSQLHGVPGRIYSAVDAHRHSVGSTAQEPEPGRNLVLTIYENIQFKVERTLDRAMEREGAQSGTVVVEDVHTGQILALAIRPSFNPNDFRHMKPELLKNHAVSDVYEPGSAFKLMTYASALDAGAVKPDDEIDCQGSQITIAGRVIHDDKGDHFGVVPVHKALEESSNVGAIKVAMKEGPQKFYQYARDFGFGSKSGIELPGETRGLLQPEKRMTESSLASMAMGQEIGVTPVQLASLVSTIANGGVYLPPHILVPEQPVAGQTPMAQPTIQAGEELPKTLPVGAHRVISELASAEMRKMMEGVVLYGTGRAAQLNGYSSGGKTGTAQKIDPRTHTYSKTQHIATFAGLAPVNNPVIAVVVVVDTPTKVDYHAAHAAAPIFTEVTQEVLEYLAVPHDAPLKKTAEKLGGAKSGEEDGDETRGGNLNTLFAVANELPEDDPLKDAAQAKAPVAAANGEGKGKSGTKLPLSAKDKSGAAVVDKNGVKVAVPKFIGLEVRKAMEAASGAGLSLRVVGSGKVKEQVPLPGVSVPKGTQVVVRCGRTGNRD